MSGSTSRAVRDEIRQIVACKPHLNESIDWTLASGGDAALYSICARSEASPLWCLAVRLS